MRAKPLSQPRSATPWRIALHVISSPEQLGEEVRVTFSRMKYGDPVAVEGLAEALTVALLRHGPLWEAVRAKGRLWLSAAPYGAVHSAAGHLTEAVARRLLAAGWPVQSFKIERLGEFDRTDFGALGRSARKRAMQHRRIVVGDALRAELKDAVVLVIDDLRCSGAHERAVAGLLQQCGVAKMSFGYCIQFQGGIRASQEEALNHEAIKGLADLEEILRGPVPALLNARMLKYLLEQPREILAGHWAGMGVGHALRCYAAALSSDGYFDMPRFRDGFLTLEDSLSRGGHIGRRQSYAARAGLAQTIAALHLRQDGERFVCAETGEDLGEWVSCYSRFKFGDVAAVQQLSRLLAGTVLRQLEAGGSLRAMFERAGEQQEYVSLVAPGVRNVVSASNYLAREVGLRVNAWLTRQGLPTMVVRTLGRLASGRANYAQLSAKERMDRDKTTQTIIPRSEYQDFPSHVVFVDDVEVSGHTLQRNRSLSLEAGALSFFALLAIKVDKEQAQQDASIEHRLNQHAITGGLDNELAQVLAHADYQPVQRMLRLLLHPRNRAALPTFLRTQVPDHSLRRCYLAALSNDYLWIRGGGDGRHGEYAPSVECMRLALKERGWEEEGY